MGALLGKYKKASMYFPGGCSIGARPINLHLKGFEAYGYKVEKVKLMDMFPNTPHCETVVKLKK